MLTPPPSAPSALAFDTVACQWARYVKSIQLLLQSALLMADGGTAARCVHWSGVPLEAWVCTLWRSCDRRRLKINRSVNHLSRSKGLGAIVAWRGGVGTRHIHASVRS